MNESRKYRHIFFDLDRTLWDFDTNSHEALEEIFSEFDLSRLGIPDFSAFYKVYAEVNALLWEQYRNHEIDRNYLSLNRFLQTNRCFGNDDETLASEMSQRYILLVSNKTRLFPHAADLLEYLSAKYKLHIITNGFADVQYRKLERSDTRRFFTEVITSEEAGFHKPSLHIFRIALQKAGAVPYESLMIGDDPEVDLQGAAAVGMDQLFFNPEAVKHHYKFTFEVRSLREIFDIL